MSHQIKQILIEFWYEYRLYDTVVFEWYFTSTEAQKAVDTMTKPSADLRIWFQFKVILLLASNSGSDCYLYS